IIVEGAASVLVDTPDGPLEVASLGRNEFVGEIAILCDVPRTATVKAAARTVTLRITKDLFFRLVAEFPEMSVEMMRELAARLEQTTKQLREAMAKSS
ncbi:MAG: Crp/Fnr family transcriptional regulator, partial [Alphaproteobacteria bacterium]